MTLHEILMLDDGECPGCPVPGVHPAEAEAQGLDAGRYAHGRRPARRHHRRFPGAPGERQPGVPLEGAGRVKTASYKKDARRLGRRKARVGKFAAKRHHWRFRSPGRLRRRGILYVM